MLKLYSYYRSSAAYRVRIALAIKQAAIEPAIIKQQAINLLKGEQRQAAYKALNPQCLLPALETDDGLITQSLAILEYLEQQYPQPPLLPSDTMAKAQVRSLSYQVAMEIHPLNNLRVLKYLEDEIGISPEQKQHWYQHWIDTGFKSIEKTLQKQANNGPYCFGNEITMADICLVPQVYNALRFNCKLENYPDIQAIYFACNDRAEFQQAAPEQQADAKP